MNKRCPGIKTCSVWIQMLLRTHSPHFCHTPLKWSKSRGINTKKGEGVLWYNIRRTIQHKEGARPKHTLTFIIHSLYNRGQLSCSRWTCTHISKEIAGDLRPTYPSLSLVHMNTHTHINPLVIHRSLQEPLWSKPTPMHNKKHEDTHAQRTMRYWYKPFYSNSNPLASNSEVVWSFVHLNIQTVYSQVTNGLHVLCQT